MSKELILGHINAALKDGRITLGEIQTITSTEDGYFSDPVSIGDYMDNGEHSLLVDLFGDLLQGRMDYLNEYGEIKYKKDSAFTVDKEAKEYLDNFLNKTYSRAWDDTKKSLLDVALVVISSGVGAGGGASLGSRVEGWSFTEQGRRLFLLLKNARDVVANGRRSQWVQRFVRMTWTHSNSASYTGFVSTEKVAVGSIIGGFSGGAAAIMGGSWLFGKYDD